jgi:deazaflavin-dependent oxidoreductase (nitroreductase family)
MPATKYRRNARVRAVNALVGLLTRLGFLPHTYLLEVRGARSGRLRTVPVTLVENGDRYLVAPYGERAWVRNVRANPRGRLIRGGRAVDIGFEELGPDEAAPVLQQYWQQVPTTRSYFGLSDDPDLDDFRRIAPERPVFRVIG